ncbi:hypothetical protein IPZ58_17855 [Streptomyces roseoverticillatus]|uniref:hypothetical protein n=1 Tax=Streptomyces roseoverticillatus TaxID=66429 RepID=UPI001F1ABB6D|nr:hypothetical protein [Streptomyces roseoverticillatus]MCF3103431.1 hypothetical protein [Streptomyces roseoverticillatus]
MPAPEQPQPQPEPSSEERPPSISIPASVPAAIPTSMRDLLASCAAADAVSKPPLMPEARGDEAPGTQDAA